MGAQVAFRRSGPLMILAVTIAGTGSARAQVPAGSTFEVAPATTFERQLRPSVVAMPVGDFVVVWNRIRQISYGDVFVQRFTPDGQRRGAEFQVNTSTANSQYAFGHPPVAAVRGRDFVVVWRDYQSGGSRGRILGAAGPLTSEFGLGMGPDGVLGASGTADGGFVVVSRVQDAGGGTDIHARLFDRRGLPDRPPFLVNTYTTGTQVWPAVAPQADGAFVVVWVADEGGGPGLFGQRFAADGTRRGAEFHVGPMAGWLSQPAVAGDADGGFVVAWENAGFIFARRYHPDGAPVAAEIQVDATSTVFSLEPTVASDGAGNFVVTWSRGSFFDGGGVWGRRFLADMTPRGGEFEVEPIYPWSSSPGVASDAHGNFLVTWDRTWDPLLTPTEVRARRYGGLRPAALEVDTTAAPPSSNGNRVLETCETVDVRPAWSNVNGQPQSFDGDVRAFTGPTGATYTLVDAAASYGTVPNAKTGACLDCYAASVSCATTRPAVHWDATLSELLRPDTHGQSMRWALHIGDSFADVTRDSPFYRFVETLLHRGITTGCAAGTFCGKAPVTREQIAVFLVKASEGPGYRPSDCSGLNGWIDVPPSSPYCPYIEELTHRGVVSGCAINRYCPTDPVTRDQLAVFVMRTAFPGFQPPACVTPLFSDVPAQSSFCRWIEELARRGVVGGCGGGRYCPSDPVPREHMAVFVSAGFGLTLYSP